MKALHYINLTVALLLLTLVGYAQTPGISYQAVVLDTNVNQMSAPGYNIGNQPLVNSNINLQFSVSDQIDGLLFVEEQTGISTDNYGMFSTTIGVGIGTSSVGLFEEICWDGTPKFLKIEIDMPGDEQGYKLLDEQLILYLPSLDKRYITGQGLPTTVSEQGYIYVDEDNGNFYVSDGTNWLIKSDDQVATEVPYDNATSGMISTDVQGAIDELEGRSLAVADLIAG
ncbi:MAG: hypothetical protein GWO82_01455, partial [Bacteroidetes bacterium]|nr:hypothetical protein [Bacteroidota bacterium]